MLTRRQFAQGALAAAVALPITARAAPESIKIGWVTVLTGPNSAPGRGYQRGMEFAVAQLNSKGGIGGRLLEVVLRDTAGDPSKAVNAITDLVSREKVDLLWGPSTSGEALAANMRIARTGLPNLSPGFIDSLMDPKGLPNIFRMAPAQSQLEESIVHYIANVLNINNVAVVSDTSAYGLAAADDQVRKFETAARNVVYHAQIDANQPDVMPDMLRARDAGTKVLVPWTPNAGLNARLMNARAKMGWDIPIVGHSALGAGEVKSLLDDLKNWEKVFAVGFRGAAFDSSGRLPARTEEFVEKISSTQKLSDTLLFWVATGHDAILTFAKAIEIAGGTDRVKLVGALASGQAFHGVLASWKWTTSDHNGLPNSDIVMVNANSFRQGAFSLAPGYR
jgi:branched-chain amino acid transport system substrate-binding protein